MISLYRDGPDHAPLLKPVIWVGTSLKDLRDFPALVQDHMGYALYAAQYGGKHQDANVMSGFGGAGVVEVIRDHRGDTFRAVYTLKFCRGGLCPSCFSEEIENGAINTATGY